MSALHGETGHDRRLLLVHAHPDDESIGTGATMAKYAAEGTHVTLVTCTLGELGEVIPANLAYLAAERENSLGEYRIGELAAACKALGVTDHRFLGGPGRWRDSGMMGLPSNGEPDCFWQADVDEAARELVAIIREVRPQVMVSYDDNGFYGHPDHIQAHRVAWRAFQLAADPAFQLAADPAFQLAADPAFQLAADPAFELAADPAVLLGAGQGGPWRVTKFYATAMPHSRLAEAITLTSAGHDATPAGFTQVASVDELPFGVADDQVTTEIDGTRYLDAKVAAMRAHATQIAVDGPFFALSDQVGQRVSGYEGYTLLAGERGAAGGPQGREGDLFGGL